MTNRVPQTQNDDELYQLSKEQLVEIIKALQNEMARLKESLNLDKQNIVETTITRLTQKNREKEATV